MAETGEINQRFMWWSWGLYFLLLPCSQNAHCWSVPFRQDIGGIFSGESEQLWRKDLQELTQWRRGVASSAEARKPSSLPSSAQQSTSCKPYLCPLVNFECLTLNMKGQLRIIVHLRNVSYMERNTKQT